MRTWCGYAKEADIWNTGGVGWGSQVGGYRQGRLAAEECTEFMRTTESSYMDKDAFEQKRWTPAFEDLREGKLAGSRQAFLRMRICPT